MITKVHSASVFVSDQDAALKFFTEVLGFKAKADMPMEMGRWLTVEPPSGNIEIALNPESWRMGAPKNSQTGFGIVCEDIHKDYEELVAKGVRFKGAPEKMPWGAYAAWFYDIDDNEYFLVDGDSE